MTGTVQTQLTGGLASAGLSVAPIVAHLDATATMMATQAGLGMTYFWVIPFTEGGVLMASLSEGQDRPHTLVVTGQPGKSHGLATPRQFVGALVHVFGFGRDSSFEAILATVQGFDGFSETINSPYLRVTPQGQHDWATWSAGLELALQAARFPAQENLRVDSLSQLQEISVSFG